MKITTQIMRIIATFSVIMLTSGTLLALPQSPLNMDNDYSDWKGGTGGAATCFADEGGVDEINLNRVDITEYCLHIDPDTSGGLYLLMAMDDTEPKNADVRVVVDVDGNQTPDYSVNNSLNYHSQKGLTISGVSVSECEDGDCALNELELVCDNDGQTSCVGTTEGFNNDWPSQFISNDCDGTNCSTQDGFIEMFVPWQWLGGVPPESYLFGMYLSAHSGGTEDTSSDITGQGVSCNDSGCYTSSPTAVTLQSFSVLSNSELDSWKGIVVLTLMLLGGFFFLGWRLKLRSS